MAALAAVQSGAGLVTVATDRENVPALHSQLPEAMALDVTDQELLAEQIAKAGLILLGPGLKDNDLGTHLVELVFDKVQPHQVLILDGGAISLYTRLGLSLPPAQLVFTPHQKEWDGDVRYSDWRPRGRSNKAGSIPTSSSKYSGPKGTPD